MASLKRKSASEEVEIMTVKEYYEDLSKRLRTELTHAKNELKATGLKLVDMEAGAAKQIINGASEISEKDGRIRDLEMQLDMQQKMTDSAIIERDRLRVEIDAVPELIKEWVEIPLYRLAQEVEKDYDQGFYREDYAQCVFNKTYKVAMLEVHPDKLSRVAVDAERKIKGCHGTVMNSLPSRGQN